MVLMFLPMILKVLVVVCLVCSLSNSIRLNKLLQIPDHYNVFKVSSWFVDIAITILNWINSLMQ